MVCFFVSIRICFLSDELIQFFVIVAVALGIASVLIVSVVQKSREIGILRAVGTPAGRVSRVFLIATIAAVWIVMAINRGIGRAVGWL